MIGQRICHDYQGAGALPRHRLKGGVELFGGACFNRQNVHADPLRGRLNLLESIDG